MTLAQLKATLRTRREGFRRRKLKTAGVAAAVGERTLTDVLRLLDELDTRCPDCERRSR